jgi:vacuolar-type H+-ATPase subunit E/Vma4
VVPRSDPTRAALEPLRAALLAQAAAEADRIRADAEAEARRRVDAARREAGQLVADARARGAAEAGWILAAEEASARRAARAVVLTAQREAWEHLREESCAAVRALLRDPAVRARLAARLTERLPGATVHDLVDGGLAAETPDGRSIDASVEALVAQALPVIEGERLWSAP